MSTHHTRRRSRADRAARAAEAAEADPRPPREPVVQEPPLTDEEEAALLPRLLESPTSGVPEPIDDEARLAEAAARLAAGSGPVAVDAERASGYRYGQRAYLVQIRREGAGTFLIDPVGCPDLSRLSEALHGVEWVLHAATQDLPCLAELGMRPTTLFDTELGARLAGQPRVGLSAVLEHYLQVTLAKEHSAVDWSSRPLPEPWLRYAALDVEVLVALRDAVEADLIAQGKLDWAREEFDSLLSFTGPAPRQDPWRRLSGINKIRSRRTLAVARELWLARDAIARERDIAPGRLIPDLALMDMAQAAPRSAAEVAQASPNRAARRYSSAWIAAVTAGLNVADAALPPMTLPADTVPPQRAWADRDPIAAARLAYVRAELSAFSEEHRLPIENLISPDALRRALWGTPMADLGAVQADLAKQGARNWQIAVVAPIIVRGIEAHPA